MNAQFKLIVPAVLAAVALSACSSTGSKAKTETPAPATQAAAPQAPAAPATVKVDSIDSAKEVAYKCGPNGADKLTVMYGIKDSQVVAAQVKFKNQLSPNLFRVTGGSDDQNAFWGNNVAWVTESATGANVDKVDGNMLTIRGTTTVNGKQEVVDQIVVKDCMLDKAATAKLAKTNAKPAAKAKKK